MTLTICLACRWQGHSRGGLHFSPSPGCRWAPLQEPVFVWGFSEGRNPHRPQGTVAPQLAENEASCGDAALVVCPQPWGTRLSVFVPLPPTL